MECKPENGMQDHMTIVRNMTIVQNKNKYSQCNLCVKLKENIRHELQYMFLTRNNLNEEEITSQSTEQNVDSSFLSI